ncbi:MAG: lipid A deacylase LpxR family protein [Candidatus Synoicihabitans palmerolidicus]|nr:lipid A deacylase LpxR family protein [Candidatus Synoicihabitans palmerolidicus]
MNPFVTFNGSILTLCLIASVAFAEDPSPVKSDTKVHWGSLTVYSENDFYFAGTDRRYTNGFKATALARNVRQFDQSFVPRPIRAAARTLGSLVPKHDTPQLAVSFGQNIYTPENIHPATPDLTDRPYAAWLYSGVTFQAYRHGEIELRDSASLELGVVGPWALGREIQNSWHEVFDILTAQGWSRQLVLLS